MMTRGVRGALLAATAVAAVAIPALGGCGDGDDGVRSLVATNYWPLQAGNTWEYRVTQRDGSTATLSREVLAPTTINGVAAHPDQQTLDGVHVLTQYVDTDTSNGIGIVGTDNTTPLAGTVRTAQPLIIPALLMPGQRSVSSVAATGTGAGAAAQQITLWTTFEAFETVTVPAGTFSAARVTTVTRLNDAAGEAVRFGHSNVRTFWVAPGVGLVRAEDGDGQVAELVSGVVNGSAIP